MMLFVFDKLFDRRRGLEILNGFLGFLLMVASLFSVFNLLMMYTASSRCTHKNIQVQNRFKAKLGTQT
jgi:hypothetical protein